MAINLLLEDIQKDVAQQEGFVQDQNIQMKEAEASLTKLHDCREVLKVADIMIN
jgi:hypothetical protein